jgi:hypothetical protein
MHPRCLDEQAWGRLIICDRVGNYSGHLGIGGAPGHMPGEVFQTAFRSTVSGGADERASSRVFLRRRAISLALIVS